MDEQVAARHRTIIARLTIALGAFGILRSIPEALAVLFYLHGQMSDRYLGVLVLDLVLGGAAFAGGFALRRWSSWGWPTVTAAWGAVAVNSVIIFLLLFSDRFRGRWNAEVLILLPRMAFYVLSVLPVPYVLWASLATVRAGHRLPRSVALVSILLVGTCCSWLGTTYVLDVQPLRIEKRKYHLEPK